MNFNRTLALVLVCLTFLVPAVTLGESGGKTLYYRAMWNETEGSAIAIKEAIASYEAATGNKVEVSWLGRDVRNTLQAAIDAGEEVDLLENTPDWLFPRLGPDYMIPLDAYLDKTYPTTDGKTLRETIIPAYIDYAKTYGEDGAIRFVPCQPALIGVLYNRDIFEEVGVTAPPATWAEFLDVCQKIKDAGYDPLTVDDAYRPYFIVSYLLLQKGQDWFYQLDNDASGEMWGDPAVLQVAQAMEELVSLGYFSPTTPSNMYPAGQQEIGLSMTAIYLVNGSWLPIEVAATAGPDFRWGACPFPAMPGAAYPSTATQVTTQGYAISSKSKNPDETAELIAYLMSVPSQQALVDKANSIPVIPGLSWPDSLADFREMQDNMTDSFTVWGDQREPAVLAALSENVGKLIAGGITGEAFVEAMKEQTKR